MNKNSSEKFISWMEKFDKETHNVNSVIDIINNRWYKKLNNLSKEEIVDVIIEQFKNKKYQKLFPILYKFYPNFKIDNKDMGKIDIVCDKFVNFIENSEVK